MLGPRELVGQTWPTMAGRNTIAWRTQHARARLAPERWRSKGATTKCPRRDDSNYVGNVWCRAALKSAPAN
eukprot:6176789-Lingulodinium_polyedra.AAC.1